MVNGKTFQSVDDFSLLELIESARRRLVFLGPGVRRVVAEAILRTAERLPNAVTVVIDVNPHVCRLGYGEVSGLEILQTAAEKGRLTLQNQPDLRIGLVISDDAMLMYTPTPLLIEAGPETSPCDSADCVCRQPNGILIRGVVPDAVEKVCSEDGLTGGAELNTKCVTKEDVANAMSSLKKIPPKQFDFARRELVFSSRICFVEFKLQGYKISSRTIELPPEFFVDDKDTQRRLKNKFKICDKESLPKDVEYEGNGRVERLSMDSIEQKILEVRQKYLIPVGKWGTVILREELEEFKAAVQVVVKQVECYRDHVVESLDESVKGSCHRLIEEIGNRIISKPTLPSLERQLRNVQSAAEKKLVVERYLVDYCMDEVKRIRKEFKPEVVMIEKDVTYATFSDPEFRRLIERRDALGADAVSRILEEHESVKGRDICDAPKPDESKGECNEWGL